MQGRGPLKTQALNLIKERGVPVNTVIDVGVQHSTPELMKAYPNIKHILFEPVEEFHGTIGTNYNKLDHILIKAAVSDETGKVALKTSRKLEGMDISHSSMVFGDSGGFESRSVPMVRLDDALGNLKLDAPYLLKIDIDGHELRALRGSTETLKQCSVVIVECVHSTIPERLSYLMNRGFRLFDMCEPCYYDKVYWQCDAVFLRNDIFHRHFEDLGSGALRPGFYETFQ